MGAGSVGCYVGGWLAAVGVDVLFVGRQRLKDDVAAYGMTLKEGDATARVEDVVVSLSMEGLARCDVVLCCVKSAQTAEVGAALPGDGLVVSLQNGMRNADVLREHVGERPVLGGIVGFNVVSRGRGIYQRTMSGPLTIEASDDARWRYVAEALGRAGFDVEEREDLAPDQWTKLIVNLNNAISALSGAPSRDLIANAGYRRIVAAVVGEGVAVLRAAGIKPARLRGVPLFVMPHAMRLPTPIVKLLTRAQMRIDPEARSSMWEDLTRGRKTEVDYLNGEIVALAERVGSDAPLNRRIVELVHAAEQTGGGTPDLSPEELWLRMTQ